MNLMEIYNEVNNRINKIDFNSLWINFKKLKFAIYNDDKVCYNGVLIDKTEEFLANTSIKYNNEYIAIYYVDEDMDFDILASKLVHEMFHGNQNINNDQRFPNEIEAVIEYKYNIFNLSNKIYENNLICKLIKKFDSNIFKQLIGIRKNRYLKSKYEYIYESKVEQIEGSANYIELETLRIINYDKYLQKLNNMIKDIKIVSNLMPIRIISYDIGALLIKILKDNRMKIDFGFTSDPIGIQLISNDDILIKNIENNIEINNVIIKYYNEIDIVINKSIINKPIFEGNAQLLGVNVYDAKFHNKYILSTYFIMYKEDQKDQILYGDFVIELNDNKVFKIYYMEK